MVSQQTFDQKVDELYKNKILELHKEFEEEGGWCGDYKDYAALHADCVQKAIEIFGLDEDYHFKVGDAVHSPRSYWSKGIVINAVNGESISPLYQVFKQMIV